MTEDGGGFSRATLFPLGEDFTDPAIAVRLFEEYKLFVGTSEALVARRQTANSFFFSLNSLLLTALGLVSREGFHRPFDWLVLLILGLTGGPVCMAWRRLIESYRQLNQAKFTLIHLLEEKLPASIFKAEWQALGEGKDPKKYKPFVSSEVWVPNLFLAVFIIVVMIGLVGGTASLIKCYSVVSTAGIPGGRGRR